MVSLVFRPPPAALWTVLMGALYLGQECLLDFIRVEGLTDYHPQEEIRRARYVRVKLKWTVITAISHGAFERLESRVSFFQLV